MPMRSLHFPEVIPPPVPKKAAGMSQEHREHASERTEPAPRVKNEIEALRDAAVETATMMEKLKGLIHSKNRHGDLQVIRSAAVRVIDNCDAMIAVEHES